jgi:PAS domain S-box-containing protein
VHLSAAFVGGDDQAAGLEQGADGYLTQPVEPKVLVATINAFLRLKVAEQALRESEERFRMALRNSPIIISNQDRELRYTWIYNPQPGFKPETALGKTDADLLAAEEAARLTEIKRCVMETGVPAREEVRTTVGGPVFFYNLTVESLRDASGDIVGVSSVKVDITEYKRTEKKLQDTLESLRRAVGATIQVMVSAVETRDPYTSGHQTRSANLARVIAEEMGLPQEKIEGIQMAGSIHDIGKLSIPAEILSKPTKLTNLEFSLIKEHASKGFEMLKDVESPWPLAEIVYQHHERMDGSGYPRSLKGDEILMEARILSVADVVEAMASHRPYRPGLGIETALNEIEKNKGVFYDNAVADACLRLFREKGFQLTGT